MKTNVRKMVLAAIFIALGVVLPFITMQIPAIGNALLPMHIPVLLCGFTCGPFYGAIVGFILPLFRSAIFGAPPMMPTALAMAVELMVYGLVSGLLYAKLQGKRFGIYLTLIPTMVIGRIAWGVTAFLLFRILGNAFTWQIFVTQAFLNAVPGIIIQLIFIPAILISVKKAGWDMQKREGEKPKKSGVI